MALYQYKDGKWHEIGGLNHRDQGKTKPLAALYQRKDGKYLPLWEAGNFRTADGLIFCTSDNMIFNVTI
jgi:hypothetical protein